MTGWWRLPSAQESGEWDPYQRLLDIAPPYGLLDFVDRADGFLYSRSSAMSEFAWSIQVGRCRFTSRDPSLEAWQRAARYKEEERTGEAQLSDASRSRLAHLSEQTREEQIAAIGRQQGGFEAFNVRSMILNAIDWMRHGKRTGPIMCDGVEPSVGPNADEPQQACGWLSGKPTDMAVTKVKDEHDATGRPVFRKGK